MRASWSALHHSFTSALNRTSAEEPSLRCDSPCPELLQFPSIASVMEHQHSAKTEAAMRFGVIRVLVAAAQSMLSSGQRRRSWSSWRCGQVLTRHTGACGVDFPDARNDLAAENIARLGDAIVTLDLERVSSVTATLLRKPGTGCSPRSDPFPTGCGGCPAYQRSHRRGSGDVVCPERQHRDATLQRFPGPSFAV